MKRFAIAGAGTLVFLASSLLGLGLWRIITAGYDAVAQRFEPGPWYTWNGNELTVYGKKTRFDIPDRENVAVEHSKLFAMSDGIVNVKMRATIKVEEPLLLTRKAYEKIQNGMSYPQVGQALGAFMTRGEMSAGFYGDIAIIQGKRRIDLSFGDGKLIDKRAEGIE
jgi:hypothetical protein